MMHAVLSSPFLVSALVLLALVAALPGLLAIARAAGIDERIGLRLRGREANTPIASSKTRVLDKIGEAASRAASQDEAQTSEIRFRLMRARYTHTNAVAIYFAARMFLLVALQLGWFLSQPLLSRYDLPDSMLLIGAGAFACLGLMLPGMIVDRRIKRAERECSDGFPDMMDLLVACVEAGLSLDAAVLRVSEELSTRHKELSLNLKTLALELRAGRTRKAAWRAFADRIGLEEAGSLATMLRQSEEMGTSLGETLRVFSSTMRQRRMLMAEEKAMALPAKMTVPLILFVFPVLLGVLIVPAIIRFQSFM